MNLRVLADAESEARVASQWYESRQPGLGRAFLDEYERVLTDILGRPLFHPRANSPRSRREIRSAVLSGFPFSVIYEVKPAELLVLAVAHHRRRPNYWRKRG